MNKDHELREVKEDTTDRPSLVSRLIRLSTPRHKRRAHQRHLFHTTPVDGDLLNGDRVASPYTRK